MVVALQYQGTQSLAALRVDRGKPPAGAPFIRDFSGSAHLVVLWYDRTLEDLRLPEGRLVEARVKGYRRKLPANPIRIVELDAVDDRVATSTRTDRASTLLNGFRYRGDADLCLDFEARNLELPGSSADELTAMAAIDDTSVLATNRFSPLYRVDRSGATAYPRIPDFKPTSAYRAPDGRIWLGGMDGELRVGRLETGFEAVRPSSNRAMLRWIDGPHDASAPFELFTMSDRGIFERFDGSDWETLRTTSQSSMVPVGGVVWLAPGEAVAIPPQPLSLEQSIYRVKRTRGVTEVSEVRISGSVGQLTGLTYAPGFGVLFVTRQSRVFVLEGTESRRIEGGYAFDFARAIAPFRGGFIYAGVGVSFAQYLPGGVEFCDEIAIASSVTPHEIEPLGDALVMAGTGPLARPCSLLILTPKPRAPERP